MPMDEFIKYLLGIRDYFFFAKGALPQDGHHGNHSNIHHAMPCYVMLCYAMLYYAMSCYVYSKNTYSVSPAP